MSTGKAAVVCAATAFAAALIYKFISKRKSAAQRQSRVGSVDPDARSQSKAWVAWARLLAALRSSKSGVLLLDGATGTEIEKLGGAMDALGWSCVAQLHVPDIVRVRCCEQVLAESRYRPMI